LIFGRWKRMFILLTSYLRLLLFRLVVSRWNKIILLTENKPQETSHDYE
jgi:hypothetical protein